MCKKKSLVSCQNPLILQQEFPVLPLGQKRVEKHNQFFLSFDSKISTLQFKKMKILTKKKDFNADYEKHIVISRFFHKCIIFMAYCEQEFHFQLKSISLSSSSSILKSPKIMFNCIFVHLEFLKLGSETEKSTLSRALANKQTNKQGEGEVVDPH